MHQMFEQRKGGESKEGQKQQSHTLEDTQTSSAHHPRRSQEVQEAGHLHQNLQLANRKVRLLHQVSN